MVLRVDSDRMRADFEALAEIGGTPEGGVARTTFSDAHFEARAWFLERGRAAGLATRVDSAANHSVVLPARDPEARTLMLGSHLDSVRRGGRYDGALGVLCALEVLRSVQDAGLELPLALEAVDFTDEEGTLIGTLGSWALTGELSAEILAAPRGGRDLLLAELERVGLSEHDLLSARRDPASLAGFLELHIEQGPVLERADTAIGIVTGIIGSSSFLIVFEGDARHAGTTPMDARRDAALGAAAFVLGVRETVTRDFPGCVATVGDIAIEPGSFNVVPGRARLRMECRSLDAAELDALEHALAVRAKVAADQWGLEVDVQRAGRWDPARTDERVRAAFTDAAGALGLSTMELPSGAGHDAQALARVTPSGMVFVPSLGGVSHDPTEHTAWKDCVNGANVLLGATVVLARSLQNGSII
ncbi:hydantase: amidase, hydantoinase/carbamoylase family [Gaiella occulta]|uniref:Hydantase: amidase, hydantoinase/carbamoylase family n=1 Tax=Gaiella occulta TaxID=1002870 RepID=A0A7M2YWU8_9ACTN|nr:Zn-dependent hydrolase [Gaiella occulta]RDI74602.1 hydantase: amidase, hydantoinase/carbamoylase family [Gaiella occulta]